MITFTTGLGGMIPFPRKVYHPIFGEREITDANEASKLNQDWFDTAELADMARTHTEAMVVMHHNQSVKVNDALETDAVARNSVAADLSKKSGAAEPL